MTDWAYCRNCGTVIDEFGKVCSGCMDSYKWNEEYKVHTVKGYDMGNKRGKWEVWFDEHNHKMEFMRTIFSMIAAITGIFVFLKVFGII